MNREECNGVFVYIEQKNGNIQNVSLELLGKAQELAGNLNQEVTAVVVGSDVAGVDKLAHYGADNIIYTNNDDLKLYMTEPYTKVLAKVIEDKKPEIFLFGATAIGRDLAPRLAGRIHTGLTADCTSLEINEENKDLMMTRPAFGGNIMATIVCPDHRPQMATVRPGVMKKAVPDMDKVVEIEDFAVEIKAEDKTYEILEVVNEVSEKMDIQEAKILVSGGRGVGTAENFEKLARLADELGGIVSSSRATVDSGVMPKEVQVGQTGKTVRPDLYVACGISGAIQHLAGMEESEFIVAINKDETAPIFDVADLGIVGDVNKVLPALVEELKMAKVEKFQ
ncbi:electron transfer flavoprotein alpha subunit apoprotein [Dethiosulfatibacter aminovorans DSM 17477]|uniref:Electron transfer flavoprotein alpha subunit apoprotein n=1 Tax=Dethiosulfatibacter aminovorans DSM 17477 TaxID=1121476 RepID=A0A1M6HRT2_9FIRM|nr:electron transfer flavoprotein subunit alpha/FixB family protein [Dethiosulfatibacter aminovorans]SHJ24858.1 electron transfer flavoprotein alpha subunit apoprotein [Dethiosulfatibacter aminovorans DSM 17477]